MKDLILNNLKGFKRRLKGLPERGRVLVARTSFDRDGNELSAVGSIVGCKFRIYSDGLCPVYIISPPNAHYMTTFFDIIPDQDNNLCMTEIPFLHRIPVRGDEANVVVLNTDTKECKTIYRTLGWGAQLGSNVRWGKNGIILCNDVLNEKVVGVSLDINTSDMKILDGPIFSVDPNNAYSYSANLEHINGLIPGYGVPDPKFRVPRQREKLSNVDGVWRTDLNTGSSELFLSINEIVSSIPDQDRFAGAVYQIFNVKVSNCGQKIFIVLFATNIKYRAGWSLQLVTCNIDGSDIKIAVSDSEWMKGGHHPNWSRFDNMITMNLKLDGKSMKFVQFDDCGEDKKIIAGGAKGSGHPSISPCGRYLVTDSYISEGFKDGDGNVPLRLIDLHTNEETTLCWIFTNNLDGPRRIDPHPVWSSQGDKIYFNGIYQGYRQVFMIDLSGLFCANEQ